jgi:hypothetical protein
LLLNLNHKTFSWKINFGKKKKIFNQKKKTIVNYARNVHVLRHTFWNIVERMLYDTKFKTCCWYINLVPARWRYFYHTYSMLCTWSAVAYKFKSQNTDSWKINFGKERKIIMRFYKMIKYAKKRTCTATYILKRSWTYVVQLQSLKPVVGTLI